MDLFLVFSHFWEHDFRQTPKLGCLTASGLAKLFVASWYLGFYVGVSLLKLNISKRGSLILKGLLENLGMCSNTWESRKFFRPKVRLS